MTNTNQEIRCHKDGVTICIDNGDCRNCRSHGNKNKGGSFAEKLGMKFGKGKGEKGEKGDMEGRKKENFHKHHENMSEEEIFAHVKAKVGDKMTDEEIRAKIQEKMGKK